MEKFQQLTAVAIPIPRDNIDTDIILPAEVISRLGPDMSRIGEGAFWGWRYDAQGKLRSDAILNQPEYKDAKILITGSNFGCGSSREHAVWTLLGYGFRCVIARSYGDIFYNNSFKKGLLVIALDPESHAAVMRAVENAAGSQPITVDLEACRISLPQGVEIEFTIDPVRREILLQGLDEIQQTLLYENDIDAFQEKDQLQRPWVYQADFHKPLAE